MSAAESLASALFRQQSAAHLSWERLTDSQKAPWRFRAEQSLRALHELGFRLEPPETAESGPNDADHAQTLLQFATREAGKMLRMGEPLLAYNAIQEALVANPDNVRLRQLKGLALARSGALQRANRELTALRGEGHKDGETMGLLARTHKDLGLGADDEQTRNRHLTAAFEIYATGYRESCRRDAVDEAYYTGINAATMAFLRGDNIRARELATEVEALCRRALQVIGSDTLEAYWPQATLAEAALILGDLEVARHRYAEAAALAGSRYADLSSTRHQARLLLAQLHENSDWLDTVLRIPPVLVFTGHMIDTPARPQPRFPPELEGAVRERIRRQVETLQPVAAYGSAACGADILCLECVRAAGGELHIVLPFPAEQFRAESVDLRPDGDWGERFERLLEYAGDVLVISEQPPPTGTSIFEYANLIMTGLARLRAQTLDTTLHGLAVWDGKGAAGQGGTGSVVTLWRQHGVSLAHIDIAAMPGPLAEDRGSAAIGPTGQGPTQAADLPFEYDIKAMLFADAVGYSRLSEDQIPLFFAHYLGSIAAFNAQTAYRPVHIETAGDGMYMVFDEPATAAYYALGLSECLRARDWPALGLPADMSARIALHCGPVFVGLDPITNTPLYSGTHTSRTARIEPVTPPGQVYASGAFAAIAAARNIPGLAFSYIGRTPLAKQYGALALYHVQRR